MTNVDKTIVPFWEETYLKDNVMTFSVEPNKTIKEFEYLLKKQSNIFTDTVPASPDIAPFAIGLAKDGEIKEMYNDWEILQFQSYTFEDEHPNVPKHMHAVNKIVAQKP